MIDATKLPRPVSGRAPTPASQDTPQDAPGGPPAVEDDVVATYPARGLVLDRGRYYATSDTK